MNLLMSNNIELQLNYISDLHTASPQQSLTRFIIAVINDATQQRVSISNTKFIFKDRLKIIYEWKVEYIIYMCIIGFMYLLRLLGLTTRAKLIFIPEWMKYKKNIRYLFKEINHTSVKF